jgi:hypothetical protein
MRVGSERPDSTQEVDASDVLEVVPVDVAREDASSTPSLIRVEVDMDVGRNDETCQIRVPSIHRKGLLFSAMGGALVLGAVLTASLFARGSPGGSETSVRHVRSLHAVAAEFLPLAGSSAGDGEGWFDPSSSSSGSIRFAASSRVPVWLDGKRLSAASAIVSCGVHQVKVGASARRNVVVPCGAEVVVR